MPINMMRSNKTSIFLPPRWDVSLLVITETIINLLKISLTEAGKCLWKRNKQAPLTHNFMNSARCCPELFNYDLLHTNIAANMLHNAV